MAYVALHWRPTAMRAARLHIVFAVVGASEIGCSFSDPQSILESGGLHTFTITVDYWSAVTKGSHQLAPSLLHDEHRTSNELGVSEMPISQLVFLDTTFPIGMIISVSNKLDALLWKIANTNIRRLPQPEMVSMQGADHP